MCFVRESVALTCEWMIGRVYFCSSGIKVCVVALAWASYAHWERMPPEVWGLEGWELAAAWTNFAFEGIATAPERKRKLGIDP